MAELIKTPEVSKAQLSLLTQNPKSGAKSTLLKLAQLICGSPNIYDLTVIQDQLSYVI